MGFSPLADMSRRIPDGNRSSTRKSRITGFTIHHNAGVDSYGEATNPSREVSANYWIANDGTIIPQIDETRRAWTTGSAKYPAGAASDHRNITVEVSNTPEGVKNKTWAISPAARLSLEKLIGDVFRRHGLGTVRRGKMAGVAIHKDFVPTSCPGPWISARLASIIQNAEGYRVGPAHAAPAPAVAPPFPLGLGPNKTSPSAVPLQRQLKKAGLLDASVPEAANYGPKTQEAVARFHNRHTQFRASGTDWDIAIGPRGWAYLFQKY